MPGYRKVVFLMCLIKHDVDILCESGLLRDDNKCLGLECKNLLIEQNDDYLDYIKNEKQSIIQRILSK